MGPSGLGKSHQLPAVLAKNDNSRMSMDETIQIWTIQLEVSDDILGHYFSCLSPDEKKRADRFRFAADRRRFVVARGTLRHLLGQQFEKRPEKIEFCYGEYGKPEMSGQPDSDFKQQAAFKQNKEVGLQAGCDFHFNLSHSGELALCALGQHRKIGVDIEKHRVITHLESMMARCFLETEQSQIKGANNPSEAFLQYWTCKEAYLKAIGLGLMQSMQTVEVQLVPPTLVEVPHDCEEGWHLDLISLPNNYVGSVVVEGKTTVQTQQ